LLRRYHWNEPELALRIESAVSTAIANGARTPDMGPASDGKATTRHVVDAVIEALNAG